MLDSIDFFINDKPCSTLKASQSVADILTIAGLSSDESFLISHDGIEHHDPNQNINIHSGDCFTTERRDHDSKPPVPEEIHYRVNGEPEATTNASLSVEQILRASGKAASIDLSQINSYILENIKTGQKYQNLADTVDILNDDEFLAVHSGATPVAFLLSP